MSLSYLSESEYFDKSKYLSNEYWTPGYTYRKWGYHKRCVELLKDLNITSPESVLEMGTMGIQLVHNSHTLDFAERYPFKGKNPTIVHDARSLPWPIRSDSYEIFIALRVFMHLVPYQRECLLEARRLSRYVMLVVPVEYPKPKKGIQYDEFVQWLGGIHPNYFQISTQGCIYLWDKLNPSYVDPRSLFDIIKLKLEMNKAWLRKFPPSLAIHRLILHIRAFLMSL